MSDAPKGWDQAGGPTDQPHFDATIKVRIKTVYGNENIYPACPLAKSFADLVGTKTLTDRSIRIIKSMGITVKVLQERDTL